MWRCYLPVTRFACFKKKNKSHFFKTKMSSVSDALIWIDLEMDGLDLTKNFILDIACIVTDFDLTKIHEGICL
jgi:hypothetical protein